MALWIGFIIGVGAGFFLSTLFIFPTDVLNLKLADMTIGDILRILVGLVVIPLVGVIGGKVFSWSACAVADFKAERNTRIEKYGKWGSGRYGGHLTDNKSEPEYRKTPAYLRKDKGRDE